MTDLKKAAMLSLEALLSYSKSPYIKHEHPKRLAAGNKAIKALEEALAKEPAPVQKPVAWKVTYQDGSQEVVYQNPSNLHADYSDIPKSIIPFYTTPPAAQPAKQERKPLTEEQIDEAWRSCDYTVPWEQHRIDIARAIEAAHGIKE